MQACKRILRGTGEQILKGFLGAEQFAAGGIDLLRGGRCNQPVIIGLRGGQTGLGSGEVGSANLPGQLDQRDFGQAQVDLGRNEL